MTRLHISGEGGQDKQRYQRLVICVDRSEGNDDSKEDDLYIYQLGDKVWNTLTKDYNDMTMSWKTKKVMMPKNFDGLSGTNSFMGAETDIGDNAFVFSFHVHSKGLFICLIG